MADLGRTYQSKRKPAHMTSEASRLREIVQKREDTIRQIRGMADAGRSDVLEVDAAQLLTDIMRKCDDALDGGGEQS
jgi:hypothetical protein